VVRRILLGSEARARVAGVRERFQLLARTEGVLSPGSTKEKGWFSEKSHALNGGERGPREEERGLFLKGCSNVRLLRKRIVR